MHSDRPIMFVNIILLQLYEYLLNNVQVTKKVCFYDRQRDRQSGERRLLHDSSWVFYLPEKKSLRCSGNASLFVN